VAKPDIFQLFVDSALQPDLPRRLAEAPDTVFDEYDLTPEERELLRHPDHRLLPCTTGLRPVAPEAQNPLPLDAQSPRGEASAASADALIQNPTLLPDAQMALTVVPCLVGGRIAYAAWISPLHEGGDPSRIPMPAGAAFPGQPLTPLHAVIQLAAAQSKDADGNLQVSMWASFRQSSNTLPPAPPEAAGDPDASPFASPLDSPEVQAAAAAVHSAPPADRYEKLVALTHTLRGGDIR
jgi:hypothetical protein